RNVLVLMQFAGFVTVYGMRANLSVALVAMVNQTYANSASGTRVYVPECRLDGGNHTVDHTLEVRNDGPFKWDQDTQGLVLGAFFYGYLVTQLPGGWLAGHYGGKSVFGLGVFFTAIFTLLTPIAARTHVALLVAVRLMAGFGEGVTYPAATVLWSRWTSPAERSAYLVFSFTGGDFGAITSMPASGYLSSLKHVDEGWPLAFYVFGALGMLWFLVWVCIIHESPAEHPRIASWERDYIEEGIGDSQDKVVKVQYTQTLSEKKNFLSLFVPVPWLKILTSVPLWAVTVEGCAYSWGWYMFLTGLPSFFKEVLDFDIKKNGALTALPFIATLIVKNTSGYVSDRLQKHPSISRSVVRKGMTFLSFLFAATLLVPVGFLNCSQQNISVLLLTLSCGSLGLYAPTGSANSVDLSPRFAGVTMAIYNCFSNITGILVPTVIGLMTNN
ncbi:predicted protein, partial [Nematostella vectensis]